MSEKYRRGPPKARKDSDSTGSVEVATDSAGADRMVFILDVWVFALLALACGCVTTSPTDPYSGMAHRPGLFRDTERR